MEKTVVNRKQVAEQFGVLPATVRAWEKAGRIKPAYHINGRPLYSKDTIEALKKKPANK